MGRFLIRFSMCREGQSYSPNLFWTNDLTTAELWSTFEGFAVFDTQSNYSHVIKL